jgi:hypothetical protein
MPSPFEAGGPPAEGDEPERGESQRDEPQPGEPHSSEPRSTPEPASPEETLRRLEQRLDQASEAAERLMAQVAAETVRAGKAARPEEPAAQDDSSAGSSEPPPAGWQIPEDEPPRVAPELDPFVTLIQAVRDLIPPELQQRLIAALREVLLALRALIDWYLERIDQRRPPGVEVQDIPIL